MEAADFSGYATKAGLKCSDGRTIMPDAFKDNDGMKVPLVWQHGHNDPANVLGHAILKERDGDVYAYGYFNSTPSGEGAKTLVKHGDITALSIYANKLVERAKNVYHGAIKEVSLVLSGANPGALIDYINLAHGDGEFEVLEDEAIIYTGLAIEYEADEDVEHADNQTDTTDTTDETIQDVYDTMTDKQKQVVEFIIGAALESADSSVSHSDTSEEETNETTDDSADEETADNAGDATGDDTGDNENSLNHKEGNEMTHRNVFEENGRTTDTKERATLTHAQIKTIMDDGDKFGSLKESFLAHAGEYGIDDIDLLFPDATMDGNGITYISRRMAWVNNVLTKTKHSPFSRIKSLSADITAEEARAKGYVKGSLKKDEVIKMLRRITTPKTIYKKQKLDRDDILDITDLDIVAWLKAEMRLMLDEELARAILIGDGRPADDDDKIDEDHIRPVAFDIDMYTTTVRVVEATDSASTLALIDALVIALNNYKGSGQPTLYTTQSLFTKFLLVKDSLGRRIYPTKADLSAALLVEDIVPVEAMESETDLIAVLVNLQDYTVGADAGGAVSMFDNFDIDYNQQKYLIETRVSGALTRPKSAIAIVVDSGHTVTPTTPTFVTSTGVLTIPTQTGTVYVNSDTGATLTAGAQTAIAPGATIDVEATPAAGYGFTHDADVEWAFTRDA